MSHGLAVSPCLWTEEIRIRNSDAMKILSHDWWADLSLQLNWLIYYIMILATDDSGLMCEDSFCSFSMPAFFAPQGVSSAWREFPEFSGNQSASSHPPTPSCLNHFTTLLATAYTASFWMMNVQTKKQKYTLLCTQWERRQFYTHQKTFLFCFEWKVCV